MILVVIILVAWMIILGPSLLKRRARTVGGINSISHFRHQLRVLEQPGPQPDAAPAYRLRSLDGSALPSEGDLGTGIVVTPKLSVVGADQLPRPALAFLGRDPSGSGSADAGARTDGTGDSHPAGIGGPEGLTEPSMRAGVPSRAPDAYARHRARRRRRDTLGVLTMVFVSTMLIGFIPGAGAAWILSLVTGVALVAYVALLVRMRQAAEERERKLRYLRPGGPHSGTAATGGRYAAEGGDNHYGASDLPVRISGRYAHPSNQTAVAH